VPNARRAFRTVRPGLQTGSDRLARSDPVRNGGGPPRSSLVQSVGARDWERPKSTAVDWIISKVVICMIVVARQKSVCRGGSFFSHGGSFLSHGGPFLSHGEKM
jgi:hypothetical protein